MESVQTGRISLTAVPYARAIQPSEFPDTERRHAVAPLEAADRRKTAQIVQPWSKAMEVLGELSGRFCFGHMASSKTLNKGQTAVLVTTQEGGIERWCQQYDTRAPSRHSETWSHGQINQCNSRALFRIFTSDRMTT
jgi:hypothetical protein